MLMSQSPRSVIMLIGTAAEWRLDDRYDEWMAIFGILTHNLMTVIPKMKKHIDSWGAVDQWHFSASDENKGIQADIILLLLQMIELLRPSEYHWSHHVAHSWDCPNALVQCRCRTLLRNRPQDKYDHWLYVRVTSRSRFRRNHVGISSAYGVLVGQSVRQVWNPVHKGYYRRAP